MIIKQSEYKVGDKVKIVELDRLKKCRAVNSSGKMDKWAGKTMTIKDFRSISGSYFMEEDQNDRTTQGGWWWGVDMIEGKVIDTVTYKGKEYREVARKANVGELIKIVKADYSFDKVGDVLCVDNEDGSLVFVLGKKHPRDTMRSDREWAYAIDEYVVLEPIEPPKKKPTVSFTVDKNTNTETVTIYGTDMYGNPMSEKVTVPGITKNKFSSIGKNPTKQYTEIRCKECGQVVAYDEVIPVKRFYTAEQIQEARDIVYRIMCAHKSVYFEFIRHGNKTILNKYAFAGRGRDGQVGTISFKKVKTKVAKCSDNDEWQDDVGRMVSLCKLTGEPMPKWVRGE